MKETRALMIAVSTAAIAVAFSASAQIASPGEGRLLRAPDSAVVTPDSSLPKPSGFANTNIKFIPSSVIRKLSAEAGQTTASPLVGPPYSGYGYETPGSLSCLYGLVTATAGCDPNSAKTVATDKGSRAIAIVDAFYYPTALADLKQFSTQFGLPTPRLVVKYATASGSCAGSKPASDFGWELEQALDVQAAHAMAPLATIYLVEAQSNYNTDLYGAIQCANSLVAAAKGAEVSLSWGSGYESGGAESAFLTGSSIVYFASSGDSPGISYPATSPKVVAVGGTSIARNYPTDLKFKYYTSWTDSGEGASTLFPLPLYQSGVAGITGQYRVIPDISADANPHTGLWVYFGDPAYGSGNVGWWVVGGTSLSSPLMAGLTNAHGTFRLNTNAELTALYADKKASAILHFATTTIGYCGPYAAFVPTPNWNYCTGMGTVKGAVTPLLQASQ